MERIKWEHHHRSAIIAGGNHEFSPPHEWWARYEKKLFKRGAFEEYEVLFRLGRFCQGCGQWAVWSYIEEDPDEGEEFGKPYGRCETCHAVFRKWPKTYFLHYMDNPIHYYEKILLLRRRWFDVCGDKTIDIGLAPLPAAKQRWAAKPPHEKAEEQGIEILDA